MTSTAVVFYSYTGNTRRVAEHLAETTDSTMHEVEPTRSRSYPNWLLRSFVPRSTVDLKDASVSDDVDAVYLGSPKWTVSCPPVNAWIDSVDLAGRSTGLFVTHAGFHVDAFVERLKSTAASGGAEPEAVLLVHRDRVERLPRTQAVRKFEYAVLSGVDGDPCVYEV